MPGVDATMGTLTVPIWLAGAASAIFMVAIFLAVRRVGATSIINSLFRIAVVAIVVYAGWVYLKRSSLQDQIVERRALDERSAALMARAIAPGSALSCLDEIAGEAVDAACEKAVFASPEAVAAAVNYVTAKLALLAEGTAYAQRTEPAYEGELAPIRAAAELDRFGIVAHVLEGRDGCSIEKCDALARFKDGGHVLANLRARTFDEHVMKYTAVWNAPRPPEGPAMAAAAPSAPLPTSLSAPPPTVAPRYDFPSSKSIPAVSIMAPEPGAGRPPAEPPATQPTAQPGAPIDITPVPPRRPPQVRAGSPPTTPRAAAVRPEGPQVPPPADPPADPSIPRPSAPVR
jgi:hypothetical protein